MDSLDDCGTMAGMEWISVDERLPDDYGDVLCWYVDAATGEGHCGFGCCEPDPQTGEREWDIAGVFDQPTHWMPLPEPPEVK